MEIAGKLLGQSASINKLFGNLTVDISKITRELSWTPLYTVSEGIADATTWFDEVSRSRLRKD
jgi:UDP-glucose 4-epimerase